MLVEPITCYRPRPEIAKDFATLPYDVYDRASAAAYVATHPRSFLAIDRPETAFSPNHDPYADDVYEKARELLAARVGDGTLVRDGTPCFYLWRQRREDREQTGIVAAFSIDDYTNGIIRRHELTRTEKEDDRVRHIASTRCQTGPVMMAYRDNPVLEALIEAAKAAEPLYDYRDERGVRQTVWRVARPAAVESLRLMLEHVSCAYITDGHHRLAAAERACRAMRTHEKERCTGGEAYNHFLGALFPASQLTILPYDRVISDANGLSEDGLVSALEAAGFTVGPRQEEPVEPSARRTFGMRAFGAWRALALRDEAPRDPVGSLDVSILQERVLAPILGIGDLREDKRIAYVGRLQGISELVERAGEEGVAFTLYPTSIDQLMAVADAKELMPPKSTWFEPKLLCGLFVRRINHCETLIDGTRRPRKEE